MQHLSVLQIKSIYNIMYNESNGCCRHSQTREKSLDWFATKDPPHSGYKRQVSSNSPYKRKLDFLVDSRKLGTNSSFRPG